MTNEEILKHGKSLSERLAKTHGLLNGEWITAEEKQAYEIMLAFYEASQPGKDSGGAQIGESPIQ